MALVLAVDPTLFNALADLFAIVGFLIVVRLLAAWRGTAAWRLTALGKGFNIDARGLIFSGANPKPRTRRWFVLHILGFGFASLPFLVEIVHLLFDAGLDFELRGEEAARVLPYRGGDYVASNLEIGCALAQALAPDRINQQCVTENALCNDLIVEEPLNIEASVPFLETKHSLQCPVLFNDLDDCRSKVDFRLGTSQFYNSVFESYRCRNMTRDVLSKFMVEDGGLLKGYDRIGQCRVILGPTSGGYNSRYELPPRVTEPCNNKLAHPARELPGSMCLFAPASLTYFNRLPMVAKRVVGVHVNDTYAFQFELDGSEILTALQNSCDMDVIDVTSIIVAIPSQEQIDNAALVGLPYAYLSQITATEQGKTEPTIFQIGYRIVIRPDENLGPYLQDLAGNRTEFCSSSSYMARDQTNVTLGTPRTAQSLFHSYIISCEVEEEGRSLVQGEAMLRKTAALALSESVRFSDRENFPRLDRLLEASLASPISVSEPEAQAVPANIVRPSVNTISLVSFGLMVFLLAFACLGAAVSWVLAFMIGRRRNGVRVPITAQQVWSRWSLECTDTEDAPMGVSNARGYLHCQPTLEPVPL